MYSVLLVDDERDILNNLAMYFPWQEGGFIVAGKAETGTEALDFLKQNPVDAIVCDIRMPGISGLDFARTVKELGLSTRIIFLTAYRKFEYAKEAFKYGIRDYLVKPPDFKELLQCLLRIKNELDIEKQEKGESDAGSAEGRVDPVIQTVITYIKGNMEHASLQNAAKMVQMNPNYLSTYFKDRVGMSFAKYLRNVRMERAKQLLPDPQYSVEWIGKIVGYSNVKNFTRSFRQFYGFPPGAYRKGKFC